MRLKLIAVLWLAPSMALAQPQPEAGPFGAADPALKGPPAVYRSVFDATTAASDEIRWKDANDEARRLGGHVGILQGDDPAAGDHAAHANHGGAVTTAPRKPTGHHHE